MAFSRAGDHRGIRLVDAAPGHAPRRRPADPRGRPGGGRPRGADLADRHAVRDGPRRRHPVPVRARTPDARGAGARDDAEPRPGAERRHPRLRPFVLVVRVRARTPGRPRAPPRRRRAADRGVVAHERPRERRGERRALLRRGGGTDLAVFVVARDGSQGLGAQVDATAAQIAAGLDAYREAYRGRPSGRRDRRAAGRPGRPQLRRLGRPLPADEPTARRGPVRHRRDHPRTRRRSSRPDPVAAHASARRTRARRPPTARRSSARQATSSGPRCCAPIASSRAGSRRCSTTAPASCAWRTR